MVVAAVLAPTIACHAADGKTTAKASWEAGIEAYNNRDYAAAVEAFERIVAVDYASADVYYNLANAYFKLGQTNSSGRPFGEGELGRSVLNYERALKLDPTNDDARYNLDIAKDLTNDTEAVPESLLVRAWNAVAGWMTTNGWARLSVAMLVVVAVLALLYLLHTSTAVRKVSFFVALVALVLFALATALSLTQRSAAIDNSRAVVIATDTTPVHSSPDSSSKIIRQPSQGVTVEVSRTEGEWSEVRFVDGEKGWIRSRSIEII